jgi:hypothetical protein
LYLAWDALSGTPLFGERKVYRSEDDLVPLLERVRDMNVPMIGIVTDKEKGLVPAVQRVFPDVPYQFCHTHFLRNCAKPLQDDLSALQTSVRRRADGVRELVNQLPKVEVEAAVAPGNSPMLEERPSEHQSGTEPSDTAPAPGAAAMALPVALSEADLVREIGELVRGNSKVSGKAPLDPVELRRHERLEEIRSLVGEAKKKTPVLRPSPRHGPYSKDSTRS